MAVGARWEPVRQQAAAVVNQPSVERSLVGELPGELSDFADGLGVGCEREESRSRKK